MTDWQRFPDGIADEIPMMKLDPDAPQVQVSCLRGTWAYGQMMSYKEGVAGLMVLPAGGTMHWVFWYDEMHYILDGRAEITYTLRQNRYTQEKTMTVEKGCVYIMPKGADVNIKVDPSGPLKDLVFIMPAPERYMPGSLKRPDGSVLA